MWTKISSYFITWKLDFYSWSLAYNNLWVFEIEFCHYNITLHFVTSTCRKSAFQYSEECWLRKFYWLGAIWTKYLPLVSVLSAAAFPCPAPSEELASDNALVVGGPVSTSNQISNSAMTKIFNFKIYIPSTLRISHEASPCPFLYSPVWSDTTLFW